MINRFSTWQNTLLILVLVISIIYALPNLYGEDPAVQISGNASAFTVGQTLLGKAEQNLQSAHIPYKSAKLDVDQILIRFFNTDTQFEAVSLLRTDLGNDYTVAVNLASATPAWLQALGASPMKKGLDLQGGIHFLLDVDMQGAVSKRLDGIVKGMSESLRQQKIRYTGINREKNNQVVIQFKDNDNLNKAYNLLRSNYMNILELSTQEGDDDQSQIIGKVSPAFLTSVSDYTMEQTLTTLRNRVNELGIAEPQVQQQGSDRISIDLPGVQDSARAKQILGGTATLEFHLVDEEHDVSNVITSGITPPGTHIYYTADNTPILLKTQIVLSGDSIVSATSSFGEDGRPIVEIMLGGGGESQFSRITHENVGHRLAILYVETKTMSTMENGKLVKSRQKIEHVISAPVIQSGLGAQFQITGLTDEKEARDLALLLRAGAMPANVDIVEDRTVGASLGLENIHLGKLSVAVAFILIAIFMAIYYRVFGIIADIALAFNLILIIAILSILGATLTLPGIAGIALTVGMAVDANVLIFERIREELRHGMSVQASIHAGFERAFTTIVDANVTTLIVALVLFGIGSGPIKGFAVTLTIGILTSMFTAVAFTRGLVNLIYGGRSDRRLSIGIKY